MIVPTHLPHRLCHKVLTLRHAIIASVFEFSGAVLMGSQVTSQLEKNSRTVSI